MLKSFIYFCGLYILVYSLHLFLYIWGVIFFSIYTFLKVYSFTNFFPQFFFIISFTIYLFRTHIVDPYSSDIEAMTPGTRRRLLEHSVYKATELKVFLKNIFKKIFKLI